MLPLIRQRQILVVDDDPFVCETVAMLLESDGHVVTPANSAQQALSLFQLGKFDLVFTDFLMPSMTGDKLAAEIKTLAPRQPVIMLTAHPEKFQRLDHPFTGIDLVIGKPFDLENLREGVALAD
jgi:CheY-like chemotaxis protein